MSIDLYKLSMFSKLIYYKAGVAPPGVCPQVRGCRWARYFVHFDPPKSGSRIVIYEGSCVLITIPRKKTMDRACQVAGAVAPLLLPPFANQDPAQNTMSEALSLRDGFWSLQPLRVRGLLFSGSGGIGYAESDVCLRAVAVFGCGA